MSYGLGLGGFAILVLDISYRKKPLFIAVFTKSCKLTVLLGCFDLFHSFGLQVLGFIFSSIAITNLLASKRVSRLGKTTEIDNIVSLKFRRYTYRLIPIPRYY